MFKVKKRFADIKESLIFLLNHVPWLDNQTTPFFIAKLNSISLQVGYLNFINDPAVLDDVYNDLKIEQNSEYFDNVMKLKTFITRGKFLATEIFPKPNTYAIRGLQPLKTSGEYIYEKNIIVLGLGTLISPLFKYGETLPKYLEYGQSLLLAHQISHAFDMTGVAYDGNGKKYDQTLFPHIILKKYTDLANCLNTEYPVSTELKFIPNINKDVADIGSFFLTAAGVERDVYKDGHNEGRLPGLNFTKQQIYFVQASQLFCEVYEPYLFIKQETKLERTKKERLNNAIKNVINFGEVFKCPPGTKMNPTTKCNLLS